MTGLCRDADEILSDREDDASNTYTLTTSQAAMFTNEWKSNDTRQSPLTNSNTFKNKANSDSKSKKRPWDDLNSNNDLKQKF